MSQAVITILTGAGAILLAGLVFAFLRGVRKVAERITSLIATVTANTAAVAKVVTALAEHMTEKDAYRLSVREQFARIDEWRAVIERRLDNRGSLAHRLDLSARNPASYASRKAQLRLLSKRKATSSCPHWRSSHHASNAASSLIGWPRSLAPS